MLEDGLLKQGVLIRHLILPGGLNEAKAVMDWVAATFPAGQVLFSLMSQYLPLGRAASCRRSTVPCAARRPGPQRSIWPRWGWRATPRTLPRRTAAMFPPLI